MLVAKCYICPWQSWIILRHTGTPPCFTFIFINGNNNCDFLLASLDDVSVPIWGQLLKERICSFRSKFFPSRVDSIEKGANMKTTDLLPLQVYLITIRRLPKFSGILSHMVSSHLCILWHHHCCYLSIFHRNLLLPNTSSCLLWI